MSNKAESQALMLETDSDVEVDFHLYAHAPDASSRQKLKQRNGKTFTGETERKRPGLSDQCANVKILALIISIAVNIILCTLLVVKAGQAPPTCSQIQTLPQPDQSGTLLSSKTILSTSSSTSTTAKPTPTSKQTSSSAPKPLGAESVAGVVNSSSPSSVPCAKTTTTSSPVCGQGPELVEAPVDQGYVNVFRDLSRGEISAVIQYVNRLALRGGGGFSLSSIFGVELHVPTKSSALSFLDSSPASSAPPAREGLASVVVTVGRRRVFRQYVVGPLPDPTYHRVNPRMTKDVAESKLVQVGMQDAFAFLNQQLNNPGVQRLLRESFHVDRVTCRGGGGYGAFDGERCLVFLPQKISFGLVSDLSFIFTTYHANAEFSTVHPLPFQVIVSEVRPSVYVVKSVFYGGATLPTLLDLVGQYDTGTIAKVSRPFPVPAANESSVPGSMNLRGRAFPASPHPPPRQYQPRGARFSVVDQHVKYLQWSFNVRNSIESGPQAWDVRWAGERIVYELSLQEIVVLYAGADPAAMLAHLSDSAFGLGNNAKGLVPGVDCPPEARYLNTWAYGANRFSPKVENLPNTACVFEHNSGVPLRRHSDPPSGKYGALVDSYLVVRTIIVEYNYDYIVDMVFHNNGALEVRVYATGYILSQWFHQGEAPFGFRVMDGVVGSIHHHLFHLKVDMDIGGLNNRYETLDFDVDDRDWPWLSALKHSATKPLFSSSSSSSSSSTRSFQQISFKHHVRKTEQDAVYHYNFDHPKYHIFYTDASKNKFGNPRAYRLQAHGFSKQLLPTAHPALRSRKWADYCMAVTQRKEAEHKSSSIFSMFDADDPVVDFEDFLRDNDTIVDKDLVTWVTLGMHHIPHTEDIPNTPTVGTLASVMLLPYNYFTEDPSIGSRDAVRKDKNRFQTYGSQTEFQCLPHTSRLGSPYKRSSP